MFVLGATDAVLTGLRVVLIFVINGSSVIAICLVISLAKDRAHRHRVGMRRLSRSWIIVIAQAVPTVTIVIAAIFIIRGLLVHNLCHTSPLFLIYHYFTLYSSLDFITFSTRLFNVNNSLPHKNYLYH